MIKKISAVKRAKRSGDSPENGDRVLLEWFDLDKKTIAAVSEKGCQFTLNLEALGIDDLREGDTLVSEDNKTIEVVLRERDLLIFEFENPSDFAICAFQIGNFHQAALIEDMKITALAGELSIERIAEKLSENRAVKIRRGIGVFRPNTRAGHKH